MKNKKLFIILIVNCLFILCLLLIGEIYTNIELRSLYGRYIISKNKFYPSVKIFNPYKMKPFFKYYRKPVVGHNGKTILILGCSYAFGYELSDKETFQGLLAEKTGFSVYNLSSCAAGPPLMLFQLSNTKLKDYIPNCNYIIYIYMDDHINRCLKSRSFPFCIYTYPYAKFNIFGKLKLHLLNEITANSNIYKFVENAFPKIYGIEYQKKLLYAVIAQSYTKSQILYPNSKFIILNYSNNDMPYQYELSQMGISIVGLKDLTSENLFQPKYQNSDLYHPNAKAWEVITPIFIEKENIKAEKEALK